MAASNAIEAIGIMLRIQWKTKTRQNCKEPKELLPLSFDSFLFICSDIITLNTVPCLARILQAN